MFLTDKVNWMQISGTFVTTGGEDHITIGSFRDDASTNLTPVNGAWPGGTYYYIDDVSVEPVIATDQACCPPTGGCAIMLPGECQALNGTPVPSATSCDPTPCNPTTTAEEPGEIKTSIVRARRIPRGRGAPGDPGALVCVGTPIDRGRGAGSGSRVPLPAPRLDLLPLVDLGDQRVDRRHHEQREGGADDHAVTSEMPMLFRAPAPGPCANTSGRWPNTVAAVVMSIGRSRIGRRLDHRARLVEPGLLQMPIGELDDQDPVLGDGSDQRDRDRSWL